MTDLKTLYNRKQNFSSYRSAQEAIANSSENPTNALYNQLDAAKQELKAVTAEIQAKIAQIKLKLMAEGVPVSKTERRKAIDARMRDEKAALDQEFADVVLGRLQSGDTVADLVKEVGAANGSMFYNATAGMLKMSQNVSQTSDRLDIKDIEWEYGDHPGTARYAISKDRKHVKLIRPDEGFVVLTFPGGSYYDGDEAIVKDYSEVRANTLVSVLDGTYAGPPYEPAVNQYA